MQRSLPSFLVSLLLHIGLLLLAYVGWTTSSKPVKVTSVAVEIVADAPSHEMVPTPVDPLAVVQPAPEPAPEDVVEPPKPDPAPKLPVPEPQKATAPAKPEKKPEAPKKDKTPPAKDGLKKPAPDKKVSAADAMLAAAAAPPTTPSKRPARPSTQATNGQSQTGKAPQDAGLESDIKALSKRLGRLWTLNCDVPGSDRIKPDIRFTLSPNGRVIKGPEWANRRADPVWEAGANLAIAAVRKGEPYTDLPSGLYNRSLLITFDAPEVCRGR